MDNVGIIAVVGVAFVVGYIVGAGAVFMVMSLVGVDPSEGLPELFMLFSGIIVGSISSFITYLRFS